nr:aldo/keto reductase [Nocardiopsis xinjiangensis]
MSHGYGEDDRDPEESVRVIHRALDLGINLFDSADVYGPFSNELLLGRALGSCPGKGQVATKCGLIAREDGTFRRDGRPEHLRRACEGSLRRLGTEVIDLYQLHRVDPEVPLAETWGALGELVQEGKVRGLGISHATREEIERVHAIHPITAIQYELSVWERRSRDALLPWCERNGVGFLAFAPLGRGFLSGRVNEGDLIEGDSRRRDPRFEEPAMRVNRAIVHGLEKVAERHGATPAQVAVAWVLAQSDSVVPIPGTRRMRWLEENHGAVRLTLTANDLKDLEGLPDAEGEMRWDEERAGRTGTEARPTDDRSRRWA